MRSNLTTLLDVALALWITLVAAQHLTVLTAALLRSLEAGARPDLRMGYWAVGGILLLGSAASRLIPVPEVSGDR